MKTTYARTALLALLVAAAAALAAAPTAAPGPWHNLLGDGSAPDWRGWKESGLPAGWHVAGGVLSKDGAVDDLVSNKSYGNFELELEWKIGKEGNSGVFYRGTREYDHIYWSAPEYQLLDDANTEDGKSALTAAGSDYALYGVPAGVAKPYGQWNKTRLVVQGNHVEHWLNGVKVVEYDFGSADWKQRVAASKFSKYPNYGLAASGLIGIQGDHPGSLEVRHIRIRELR
jgi:3-keto-disaccharide hydrolase